VLGYVHFWQPAIEAAIAASVFALAVELARDPAEPTAMRRHPWVMAGLFGLLHGLGFATVLTDAASRARTFLPRSSRSTSASRLGSSSSSRSCSRCDGSSAGTRGLPGMDARRAALRDGHARRVLVARAHRGDAALASAAARSSIAFTRSGTASRWARFTIHAGTEPPTSVRMSYTTSVPPAAGARCQCPSLICTRTKRDVGGGPSPSIAVVRMSIVPSGAVSRRARSTTSRSFSSGIASCS
jgi:hypothetical protein